MQRLADRVGASQAPSLWLPETLCDDPGLHEIVLAKHFGDLRRGAMDLPPDVRIVLLCFTNRCGSNLLAEALTQGGSANNAQEAFNSDYVIECADRAGLRSLNAYIGWLVRTEAVDGCFTAKIAWEQLVMLGRNGMLAELAPRLRFVMIERRDKIGQAVSIAIAQQTGQWASYLPAEKAERDLAYSGRDLGLLVDWICAMEGNFARFFGHNGLAPVRVVYEDFLADPQAHVDRIAALAGIAPFAVDLSNTLLRRQATALNAAWRARYLAEARERSG